MPKIKPEWVISKDAEALVKKLCELYPEKFGHIEPSTIGCAAVINKDKGETQDDSKIRGLREPESIFSAKIYIISFFMNCWEDYTPAQRAAMIMKNLLRIPDLEDGPDGSVAKLDLQDSKCLVKAFGVDYMDSTGLPDLSQAKQPLPE